MDNSGETEPVSVSILATIIQGCLLSFSPEPPALRTVTQEFIFRYDSPPGWHTIWSKKRGTHGVLQRLCTRVLAITDHTIVYNTR